MTVPVHLHLPSLAAWPASLPIVSPRFGCFLALDARAISDDVLGAFAELLLKNGLGWVSTWGPACGRLESAFDDAIVRTFPEEDTDTVIMTTGHESDSLEKALEYFVLYASIGPAYRAFEEARLLVSVGNVAYAEAIRACLKNGFEA